jgi:hypothetical protein
LFFTIVRFSFSISFFFSVTLTNVLSSLFHAALVDADDRHGHSLSSLRLILEDCVRRQVDFVELTIGEKMRVETFRLPVIGDLLPFTVDGGRVQIGIEQLRHLLKSAESSLFEQAKSAKEFANQKNIQVLKQKREQLAMLRKSDPAAFDAKTKAEFGEFFCSRPDCDKHITKFNPTGYKGYKRAHGAAAHFFVNHGQHFSPSSHVIIQCDPLDPSAATSIQLCDGKVPQAFLDKLKQNKPKKRKAQPAGGQGGKKGRVSNAFSVSIASAAAAPEAPSEPQDSGTFIFRCMHAYFLWNLS